MSKYYKAEDVDLVCIKNFANGDVLSAIRNLPTIEVSEDCISRADAINAYNEAVDELVKAEMEEFNLGDFTECSFNTTQLKLIARKIENAPSVVPNRAEGEWILECDAEGEGDNLYRCPECGQRCGCQEYDLPNYCGNCGAKMKGADDE